MRRRFDHLHTELCVAVGERLPRYALWLWLREHGRDPEDLSREDVDTFCDAELAAFLRTREVFLPARLRKRLRKRLGRFDPRFPTPEERLASLTE
ncbi:MAG: hypothetical protein CL910_03850 [Deltaproteobacteria bacterium]|jgi:hypothetical protein|nr:hypothetical protein [Deltaproteobacteria bacterium]